MECSRGTVQYRVNVLVPLIYSSRLVYRQKQIINFHLCVQQPLQSSRTNDKKQIGSEKLEKDQRDGDYT